MPNLSPIIILNQILPILMQYTVPTTLVATILQAESNWNPNALGDYRPTPQGEQASSIGLFQLHLGGQADAAIKDGHSFQDLADPLLNTQYAMPAIQSAWDQCQPMRAFDMDWWYTFASLSGHPGGVPGVDPANIAEASNLQSIYLTHDQVRGMDMVQYSSVGEVGDFNQADQFQPAKSQFECGWFSTFIFDSMSPVGQTPALTVQQVIDDSEKYYAAAYGGDNSIGNMNGMSDQQLYDLLSQIGRHYQSTDMNVDTIRAWLRLGYPVIVGVYETSVYDLDLGGNPYPWTPAGTHVILVTGPGQGDSLVVRDPANCTNLYDPNSLRPGPRHYSASRLQFVSATAVVPAWMPRPPAGYNPLKDGSFMGIPTGWSDNGSILTPPHGNPIKGGERDLILNANPQWPDWDWPIEDGVDGVIVEESNPALGYGWRRLYNGSQIEYTAKRGFFQGWVGQELQHVRADRDAKNALIAAANAKVADDAQTITALQAQVASLQAQVASGVPANVQAAIDQAAQLLDTVETKPTTPPTTGTK